MPLRRSPLFLLSAFLIGGVAGCDLPNAILDLAEEGTPRFQARFAVPVEAMAVGVESFLPDFITVVDGLFLAAVEESSASRTLGAACPACVPLHGQLANKPGFADTMVVTAFMPEDVISATLAGGVARLEITHDFGFDPLRPGPGASGVLTIAIMNQGSVIGSIAIDEPFPSGATIVRDVPITPGVVTGEFVAVAVLVSPPGSPTFIDRNRSMSVVLRPRDILIEEAVLRVEDRSVDVEEIDLDLSDIHESLRERIRGGAVRLAIENPFAVAGDLQLRVTGNGNQVVRGISVAAHQTGDVWQSVVLSRSDFEQVLDERLLLSVHGSVDAPPEGVTVRPNQEIQIDARVEFELILGLGGGDL